MPMSLETVEQILMRSYRPYAPFVMQVTHDGRLFETVFAAGDVREWFEDMFGHRKRPLPDVWYEVPVDRERQLIARVLFNAHAYAEFEFDRIGLDPRQRPFVPRMLPNIQELLARKGERCEICFEPWCDERAPESPLLHDWETCCTHFACSECWSRLSAPRCPWCKWDLRSFLRDITATQVLPVEPRCVQPEPEDMVHVETAHVGWLYTTCGALQARCRHNPDAECYPFYVALDGLVVGLSNPFYSMDEYEIRDEDCRLWAVEAAEDGADAVLSRLAWLFGRATRTRRGAP